VRDPLVHGSRHVFHADVDDSFEGEERPSDIRAKIDAHRARSVHIKLSKEMTNENLGED
jgi:hypothetical protein